MKVELHPEADAEFAAQVEYDEDRQPGLDVIASFEPTHRTTTNCGAPARLT